MSIANARVGGSRMAPPTTEIGFYNDFLTLTSLPVPEQIVGTDENATSVVVQAHRQRNFVPARPAMREVSYTLRPMLWRAPWNNGLHGAVRRNRVPVVPGQRDFYRSPRFLRSAPAVPWDAGSAIGASGTRGGDS